MNDRINKSLKLIPFIVQQWVALHQAVDKMEKLVAAEVEDPLNKVGKTEFLTIPQTEVVVCKN